MKVKATAIYRPRGDSGRFVETNVGPAVKASVVAGCRLVQEKAKALAAVDTGEMRDGIVVEIDASGKTVQGHVISTSDHGGYVEFGTGIAGAGSPGTGEGPYNMSWPGMVAQPYMRPAADESQEAVKEIFKGNIAVAVR